MYRKRSGDATESGGGPPGPPPDPVAEAREICLRLLTVRPRSRAELALALRRRGVAGQVSDAVLGRLTEVGLVDDRAFADLYVSSRQGRRAMGRRAVADRLRQRGVAPEITELAVSVIDAEAELASARELVAVKLRGTESQPAPVRARRAAAMLARRGYPAGLAARVVAEALELEEMDVGDMESLDQN